MRDGEVDIATVQLAIALPLVVVAATWTPKPASIAPSIVAVLKAGFPKSIDLLSGSRFSCVVHDDLFGSVSETEDNRAYRLIGDDRCERHLIGTSICLVAVFKLGGVGLSSSSFGSVA